VQHVPPQQPEPWQHVPLQQNGVSQHVSLQQKVVMSQQVVPQHLWVI
jgi:hypothetical protein